MSVRHAKKNNFDNSTSILGDVGAALLAVLAAVSCLLSAGFVAGGVLVKVLGWAG